MTDSNLNPSTENAVALEDNLDNLQDQSENTEAETTEDSANSEKIDSEASNKDSEQETEHDNDSTPKGVKKRFGKLTKEREDAKRETEYWKNVALNGKPENTSNSNSQVKNDKPQLADFGYDVELYTDALTDWKVDQKLDAKLAQQAAKSKQNQLGSEFEQRGKEFQKNVPDYEEAVLDAFSDSPLDRESAIVIQESEIGPEIAYYLATHEEELDKLKSVSPTRRLVEIGRIETRLGSGNKVAPAATKEIKQAPAPIKSVKGNASVTATKRVEEMTFLEYERYEREQYAKKHK